jgi:hypothetical protein
VTSEERQQAVAKLSTQFLETQRGIEAQEAERIAGRIGSDDQVLEIAIQWMESGSWPDEPDLEGWTPADLGRLYRPSFVLTSLLWLKEDPEQARQSLKHAFADPEMPYQSNVTSDPVAAGFFARRRRSSGES